MKVWNASKQIIYWLWRHAPTHQNAGIDEISLTGLSGDPADTINESLLTTQNDIIVRGASIAERLNIAASRIVARLASGNVVGATAAEIATLIQGSIDHGSIGGLGDDDHTQYILHSLADAANDFLAASGANTYVKKTLAETLTILGKAAASGLASLNASTKVVEQPASITDHLDGSPDEDDATKAPTSEWAFDHKAATTAIHGAGSDHLALFGDASTLVNRVIWKDASERPLQALNQTNDTGYVDLDLTAYTSANAKFVILRGLIKVDAYTDGIIYLAVRKNGATPDADAFYIWPTLVVDDRVANSGIVGLDSGQVVEYYLRFSGTAQADFYLDVLGYIE